MLFEIILPDTKTEVPSYRQGEWDNQVSKIILEGHEEPRFDSRQEPEYLLPYTDHLVSYLIGQWRFFHLG